MNIFRDKANIKIERNFEILNHFACKIFGLPEIFLRYLVQPKSSKLIQSLQLCLRFGEILNLRFKITSKFRGFSQALYILTKYIFNPINKFIPTIT